MGDLQCTLLVTPSNKHAISRHFVKYGPVGLEYAAMKVKLGEQGHSRTSCGAENGPQLERETLLDCPFHPPTPYPSHIL